MKVIVDFCILPVVADQSITPYVAECQGIFEDMGLSYQLHAYGTNVSGEWDTVMDAIKRCHMRVHEMGAARISSTLKLGTRTDKSQTLEDKTASVARFLAQQKKVFS